MHKHVERAPLPGKGRESGGNGVRIGHVDANSEHLGGPGDAQPRDCSIQGGLAASHDGHRGTLGSNAFSDRQAHTLAATGDDS